MSKTIAIGSDGMRRLMVAVLQDATSALAGGAGPGRGRLYRETVEWVDSDDADWAFSFVNVCEFLGHDPDAVRRRLARYMGSHDGVTSTRTTVPMIRSVSSHGSKWLTRSSIGG